GLDMINRYWGSCLEKPSKSLNNDSNGEGAVNSYYAPNPSASGSRLPMGLLLLTLTRTFKLDPFHLLALPSFRDVPISEKPNLFLQKLTMCCVVFDFRDPPPRISRRKRLRGRHSSSSLTTSHQLALTKLRSGADKMVAVNLFRTFPSANHETKILEMHDLEDEEPSLEPAWPHIQVILLRFVASPMTDAKLAKRYIDHSFLLDLFDSEDHKRERVSENHSPPCLREISWPYIIKAINNIFYGGFISETEKHTGIAELLEILGKEHKLFLVRALIPLHKPKCASVYYQQLSYCIVSTSSSRIAYQRPAKVWPVTNSSKEVMFLLEEVLEATQAAEFQRCMVPLFRQIARCLNSFTFPGSTSCFCVFSLDKSLLTYKEVVAERALFLWNNDHIRNLITQNHKRNTRGHWNQAVKTLTLNVRKVFSDVDQALFDEKGRKIETRQSSDLCGVNKGSKNMDEGADLAASKTKRRAGPDLCP
ncbi:LOW QUALITY PROTEIN: hypothetical protein HID58_095205, partial [Brassica napus]